MQVGKELDRFLERVVAKLRGQKSDIRAGLGVLILGPGKRRLRPYDGYKMRIRLKKAILTKRNHSSILPEECTQTQVRQKLKAMEVDDEKIFSLIVSAPTLQEFLADAADVLVLLVLPKAEGVRAEFVQYLTKSSLVHKMRVFTTEELYHEVVSNRPTIKKPYLVEVMEIFSRFTAHLYCFRGYRSLEDQVLSVLDDFWRYVVISDIYRKDVWLPP
jgi:hypothetical protein